MYIRYIVIKMVSISTELNEYPNINIHNINVKQFKTLCKKLKIKQEKNNNDIGVYQSATFECEDLIINLFTIHSK